MIRNDQATFALSSPSLHVRSPRKASPTGPRLSADSPYQGSGSKLPGTPHSSTHKAKVDLSTEHSHSFPSSGLNTLGSSSSPPREQGRVSLASVPAGPRAYVEVLINENEEDNDDDEEDREELREGDEENEVEGDVGAELDGEGSGSEDDEDEEEEEEEEEEDEELEEESDGSESEDLDAGSTVGHRNKPTLLR